jgi:rRNA-processing protein FCF1
MQALEYAQHLSIVTDVDGCTVDEKIVNYALNRRVGVATLDAKLGRELRKAGVTIVTCRRDKIFVNGARAIPKDS